MMNLMKMKRNVVENLKVMDFVENYMECGGKLENDVFC